MSMNVAVGLTVPGYLYLSTVEGSPTSTSTTSTSSSRSAAKLLVRPSSGNTLKVNLATLPVISPDVPPAPCKVLLMISVIRGVDGGRRGPSDEEAAEMVKEP